MTWAERFSRFKSSERRNKEVIITIRGLKTKKKKFLLIYYFSRPRSFKIAGPTNPRSEQRQCPILETRLCGRADSINYEPKFADKIVLNGS